MGTQGWLRLGSELLHFFSFFLFCKSKVATVTVGSAPLSPTPRGSSASLPCPGTLTHLGHAQDHQELPEDVDEVEKEINTVPGGGRDGWMLRGGHPTLCVTPPCPQHPPDVILVAALRLLNDELCVEEHEATHDHQRHIQVGLWGEKTREVGTVPCRCHLSVGPSSAGGRAGGSGLTVKSQVDLTKALIREERRIRVRPESRKPAGGGQRVRARSEEPLSPHRESPAPQESSPKPLSPPRYR